MTKTYDFDDWYAANEAPEKPQTRPFRFGGRLWQIPVDPPAAPLLRMGRAFRRLATLDDNDRVPAEVADAMDSQRLLYDLIGDDMADQWATLPGVTLGKLEAVAWRLYRHYAYIQPLDPPDAEGEPPAPTGAETSSPGSSTTGQ